MKRTHPGIDPETAPAPKASPEPLGEAERRDDEQPEVRDAAERLLRVRGGENRYAVYAPQKFGGKWTEADEQKFLSDVRQDYAILAYAYLGIRRVMIVEYCYRWPDGREEVRYRRPAGSDGAAQIRDEVGALQRRLGKDCPYFVREVLAAPPAPPAAEPRCPTCKGTGYVQDAHDISRCHDCSPAEPAVSVGVLPTEPGVWRTGSVLYFVWCEREFSGGDEPCLMARQLNDNGSSVRTCQVSELPRGDWHRLESPAALRERCEASVIELPRRSRP